VGTAHDHSHEQTASCSCGHDHAALPTRVVAAGESDIVSQIRTSALNAVFGATPARRAVLRALGLTTALAAVETVMPLRMLEALAQEKRQPEKAELTVGFIAITCCTPLVMADNLGLF